MMTFEDFWSIYPRKVCRKAAERSWKAAIKRATPETIISAARRYAESRKGQDQTYTCHATTWLNGDRWEDWPAPVTQTVQHKSVDDLNALWIIKHGYAAWIPDSWVRRAIAIGILNKETAERAGYSL